MKPLLICCLIVGLYYVQGGPVDKRGLSSYFSNSYFDEMAVSICASISSGSAGYTFPVRRTCGSSQTCHTICTSKDIAKQATWTSTSVSCTESLHVYQSRPTLAPNPAGNTDVGKIGLVVYRYHSCYTKGCGPNYCCCKK